MIPRRRLAIPRRVAFWLVAWIFAAIMIGTTLPTPLYVIYQGEWHFSSGTLTLIFAIYAAGVLIALLLAGRSSDQVGRRPVMAAALALIAVSTVVFILAPDVGALFLGRILSGFSAGLITGTGTAAITEMAGASSSRRASQVATAANIGGLGCGPLLAGVIAQFAPRPTVLVYEVYLGVLATAALSLVLVPETLRTRQPFNLRFAGLGMPDPGRSEFIAAGIGGFAAFSVLGLFTALAPTFLRSVLHERSHLVGGAVVFLIFAVAAATQVNVARFQSRRVMTFGLILFLAGLALVVAGLSSASMPLFLSGTVISGIAGGSVFVGSLSIANGLAPPERRGQVVSTFFVFSYVGLTIPVVAVGIASQYFGDFRPVLVCAIALALMSVLSAGIIRRAR